MPKLTDEAWNDALEACGGDMSQDDVINLVYADGPNALWAEKVEQMKVTYDSIYKYLTGLFPTREWKDWSGVSDMGRAYHAAHIPFDMGIFQRSMQICSPGSANECHTDYCEIPQGGISALPDLEMYKTGFKTRPMCIANIRTSNHARQIAEMIVKERFAVDEQVMNIFYTMALIRMTGHKWILETETDTDGSIIPVENVNPYNALQGYRYSYMNPLYPQAGNPNNIMPIDMAFLDYFGSSLADSRNPNFIAKGGRGEPLFELWYPDDWYKREVLDNPEYIERAKYTMKVPMLNGSLYEDQERHTIGNFIFRSVAALPRFAESTDGGLAVVQSRRDVEVDSGVRSVYDYREYRNAPFFLVQAIGKDAGEILSRPAISTGIEGMQIMPITGNAGWQYRNDYDPTCNEDLNMPHFRKRFEMGFRMKNPDASWGFIARAKKHRLRSPSTCDLQPVFKITPKTQDCSILTIGCNPLNEKVSNNITSSSAVRKVKCSTKSCGDSANLHYRVSIQKENQDSIAPGQSPLGACVCGSTIQVHIGDADGDTTKVRSATLIEIFRPNVVNPDWTAIIKLASSLSAGECIQNIGCPDATPTYGLVVSCADHTEDEAIPEDGIKVVLESSLNCNVGSDVLVGFYNAAGTLIDSAIAGVIDSVDPDTLTYVISTSEAGFGCSFKEDAVTIRVTCD